MADSPVNIARILRRREFCTTKKKPIHGTEFSHTALYLRQKVRTADYNAEKHADDEVPKRHAHHDADDSKVLGSVYAMPCVPQSFFDKVNSENKDERANEHNGYET